MAETNPNTTKKKKRKNSNEGDDLPHALLTCCRSGDVSGALSLFRSATYATAGVRISGHHFNSLLHLLSSSTSPDESLVQSASQIFDSMVSYGISPTEATITSMARIASSHGSDGGDLAFDLVKSMKGKYGISPRLRTYTPALTFFCQNLQAEKAYSVEDHMGKMGISPEETELAKLLEVSSRTWNESKVYEYLHKLRCHVDRVGPATSEVMEQWFESERAGEAGSVEWDSDSDRGKDVILRNGGGYYGKGWIGRGKWEVKRARVGLDGVCDGCGYTLGAVDLGESERERFVELVADLALKRETQANFQLFQEWLENHGDYETIIDGANVGLYQQNFADGGFSLSQLDAVINEMRNRNKNKKWPLVILHNRRVLALTENPESRDLIETWRAEGALYTTPSGSNDDWYWLYAAIKLKCLLVTNDEMRDHIFELLANSFFPRWKERHQVKYTFNKGNLELMMPPTYSSVIQESELGFWHAPIDDKCENERERTWLCITRPSFSKFCNEKKVKSDG